MASRTAAGPSRSRTPSASSGCRRSASSPCSGRGSAESGRSSGRGSSRRQSSRTASPRRKSPRHGPGLVARLIRAFGRLLRAIWMGIAHLIGGAARRLGHGARDLDPAHRRDGLGLLSIAAAILVAASAWWGLSGTFGDVVHGLVAGTVGALDWLLPFALIALAWRLLRHPDRNAPVGRLFIGWVCVALGLLGIVHVANGTPLPPEGATAMRGAGGFLGFLAAGPLVSAVGPYVAVALLALLTGFGALVVSGTPLHLIPE